jgi:hypothetical protein
MISVIALVVQQGIGIDAFDQIMGKGDIALAVRACRSSGGEGQARLLRHGSSCLARRASDPGIAQRASKRTRTVAHLMDMDQLNLVRMKPCEQGLIHPSAPL